VIEIVIIIIICWNCYLFIFWCLCSIFTTTSLIIENRSVLHIERASVTQSALRACVFVLKQFWQFLAFGWHSCRTFCILYHIFSHIVLYWPSSTWAQMCTVLGKSKLTVPRNSNNSTRSLKLENFEDRVSSQELRVSSQGLRVSSRELQVSRWETKSLSASLTFHVTISVTFSVSEKRVKGHHFITLRRPSNGDGCRRSLAHCQSDCTKSKNIQVSSLACSQFRYTGLPTEKIQCWKRSNIIV